MRKILNKNFLYPLVLILIAIVISFQNYTPGTFLSGWDTLHPEFNFAINFQRLFSGVFRPEQGLGAVAGHSHMADLPRVILLFISSFVLPVSFLRYFYMFLMLTLGPLGIYFLLEKEVIKDKNISFLASLFYLLNIGTVQIFYVPFEMFATQYGFLPWIFLFATQYLKGNSKKSLILFSVATLLSTPIAYAATLWYVQFAFLFLFIASFIKLNKTEGIKKRALKLIGLTLAINSFWILPNIYFVLNYGSAVLEANINKIFSPQAFLYNREFGDFKSVLLIRNFLFDWNVYVGNGNFAQLLQTWNMHLINLVFLGFAFAILFILGIINSFFSKNKVLLSFIPGLILCLFLLINDNFPTGFIYTFLQAHFSIFREALRFPDDKVLGLFIFCFTIFLAFGLKFAEGFISKLSKKLSFVAALLVIVALFWFCLPVFSGNLISPQMRVKIPSEYFSIFNYLNAQKDGGRIANLPINSFWGWEYYDWYGDKAPSFQGAGFLWFGIKQPILERDFDRWNPNNEQYYREMSYAIYTQNTSLLENVIKKYDIHYVLLDESIIAPQSNPNVLFYKETKQNLQTLVDQHFMNAAKKFGKISLYQVASESQTQNFIQIPLSIPNIYADAGFEKFGNYISSSSLNLLDNSSALETSLFQISSSGITLKNAGIATNPSSYVTSEKNIDAAVFAQVDSTNKLTVSFYPDSFIQNKKPAPIIAQISLGSKQVDNTTLSINQKDNFSLKDVSSSPKALGRVLLSTENANAISLYDDSQSSSIKPDFSTLNYSLMPCSQDAKNTSTFGIDVADDGSGFTISGRDSDICMIIPVSEIQNGAKRITDNSLVGMSFSYTGDKNPDVCAINLLTGGCIKNIENGKSKIGSSDIGSLGVQIKLDASTHSVTSPTLFGIVLREAVQEKASYQNVSFTITQPFYSASLDSKSLKQSLSLSQNISGNNSLFIPFIKTDEFSKDITQITQPNNSCPSAAQDTDKKISPDHIEYISKNGTYCDFFSYQNLPQNTSYAIAITSKNISGLPLTICVSNPYTNHCDIYATLLGSKEKTQTVFVLPPQSADKNGFTIDVNNFAINKTPSVNDLYSIQVTPFPYSWLTTSQTATQIKNKEIIIYPYSFDPGWKAYQVSNLNFWTQNFPFIFGRQIVNHVKINGWENGWIADAGETNEQVVIIFLPQFLEYLGLIVITMIFASLIFLTLKPKKA